MNYKVSKLFLYPIKSLGGIEMDSHKIDERGFYLDRRWMLVDENNNFLTQRRIPELTLVKTKLQDDTIYLTHSRNKEFVLQIPVNKYSDEKLDVTIFGKQTQGYVVSANIDRAFTELLNIKTRLVFMPDNIKRYVEKKYSDNENVVGYADGYPFLLAGEESLNELNKRLTEKIHISRFRPNIVFSGGEAFDEDAWDDIKINNIKFKVVKPCARCVIVNVNQDTAIKNAEPLTVLSQFRKAGNKVLFGQNLIHYSRGQISVGDEIEILTLKD